MHAHLVQAREILGVDLSALEAAAANSAETVAEARSVAMQHLRDHNVIADESEDLRLGLVAFGSLARDEASQKQSDFDHAVVAFRTVEAPEHIQEYRRAAQRVCQVTGLKGPGASQVFGGLISGAELINRIGLDDDTNKTHTQRMLFLEESIPIIGQFGHRKTLETILKRYLVDYRSEGYEKPGVPRFLLNDVVRYWRTIAVDYQAKRWNEIQPFSDLEDDGETKPKWGMRYIKLRSTRKLAFAGTLVSLLVPRVTGQNVTEVLLAEQFEVPAIARLAQLVTFLNDADREVLGDILTAADWFVGRFDDEEFRDEVNKVENPRDPKNNAAFVEAREWTAKLQVSLSCLFQSENALAVQGVAEPASMHSLTGHYLVF